MKDLLTNGTLNRRYAKVILHKKQWSERWSYSNRMVLIMLIVSSSDWMVLFFLLLFVFFLVTVVVSTDRYAFYGWAGEYSIWTLNENFSFLSLIMKQHWQCPRRWWPLQCSGKVSPEWWVPPHLHLFPEGQSLRENMIAPLEWWHLLEFLWGNRVTNFQAVNAYLCTTEDLLESYHRLP
jgi:hypothetical protein